MTVVEASHGFLRLDVGAVWRYRELLYFLMWRDVKVRYKQTLLGVAWALLIPLSTVVVFTVVFGRFARIPSDGFPYAVFALAGFLPWSYFSQALSRSAGSLVGNAHLLTKIYFPRLLVPVAAAATPMVDLACAFVAMLGLMGWYGVTPGWGVLLLPLFIAYAGVTAVAVALWLAPLNARFRDVGHTLPVLVQCWLYATPIVYPLSLVPEPWQVVFRLNPMVTVVEGFRWGLLRGTAPDPGGLVTGFVVVAVILLGGLVFFRRMERTLADVV